MTNDQRRRVAKAILDEFDIAEAVEIIVNLGLGWGKPYDREAALGINGLPPQEALAKLQANPRKLAARTVPSSPRA